MPSIMTVLGPIAPEQLGVTSMHDHVLAVLAPFFQRPMTDDAKSSCPIDINAEIRMENLCYLNRTGLRGSCTDNWDLTNAGYMQREVACFKARGGSAILEASAPGMRTNIRGVRDIAKATGVHIIASTGIYVRDSWPEQFHAMDEAGFRAYLLQEIRHGIDDTEIKPGHIKTAIRRRGQCAYGRTYNAYQGRLLGSYSDRKRRVSEVADALGRRLRLCRHT